MKNQNIPKESNKSSSQQNPSREGQNRFEKDTDVKSNSSQSKSDLNKTSSKQGQR